MRSRKSSRKHKFSSRKHKYGKKHSLKKHTKYTKLIKRRSREIPSYNFCKTGILNPDEQYNQNIHNYVGKTFCERCSKFYPLRCIGSKKWI